MSESAAKPPFDPNNQKQVQDRARQAKDRQRESDAAIKAFTASAVATLPATSCTRLDSFLMRVT